MTVDGPWVQNGHCDHLVLRDFWVRSDVAGVGLIGDPVDRPYGLTYHLSPASPREWNLGWSPIRAKGIQALQEGRRWKKKGGPHYPAGSWLLQAI